MRRIREAGVFGGLALGLHVVALAGLPTPPPGGAPASGGDPIAVSAPDAELLSLVEAWDAHPAINGSAKAPVPPVKVPAPVPKVASLAVPTRPSQGGQVATALKSPEIPRDPAERPPAVRPKARPFAPPSAIPKGAAGQAREVSRASAPGTSSAALEKQLASAVRAALTRARVYPAQARERGLTGTAELDLTIARDGRLIAARVVRGSGSDLLDRAALATAERAAFPAAPAALRDARFSFRLGLVYDLN